MGSQSWVTTVTTLIVIIVVGFVAVMKEGILVGLVIGLVVGAVFRLLVLGAYFIVIALLYGGFSFLFGRRTQQ